MSELFVADLHLGHEKVAELRGFDSVEEHDAMVMEPLLRVNPRGRVWILGDISSGKDSAAAEHAFRWLRQVRAEKHLIAGNHDACSSIHRRGYLHLPEWNEHFSSIQQFARIRVNNQDVLMSHYPYARSADGPGRDQVGRYLEYRLPDLGLPLIHGHTHQEFPHASVLASWSLEPGVGAVIGLDVSQFCVSWDAHRGPVGRKELDEWIAVWKASGEA